MKTDTDGEVQAVGVVVDVAQQRIARVLGVIEMHARVEADQIVHLIGVVEVGIVLVPDVLEFRGIQAGGEVRNRTPGYPGPVQVAAFAVVWQFAIRGADAAVPALVVELGEAGLAGVEHQAVEAFVGQADPAKGLRQHAAFAPGDHRIVQEQVAGLELGVEGLELERRPCGREGIRSLAVLVTFFAGTADRQDAGVAGTATAIEFQAEHGMRIKAEAEWALRVARLKLANEALAPLLVIALALRELVAIHVVVTAKQFEAGAFDETFSGFVVCLGCERHRCSQCNE